MFTGILIWMTLCGFVSLDFVCPAGWFGRSCQYKCRCLTNKCGLDDGRCVNDIGCQRGWFGPVCQYADLAQSGTVNTRMSYRHLAVVTDGSEATCLEESIQEFSLRWNVPYQVTWLRIYVRDSYQVNQFTVKFRTASYRNIPCKNMRTSQISDTAFDIHCDLDVTVTQVIVSWRGQLNLCSLYISGGRNIALKQATNQTSTYSRNFETSVSSNAVDGDTRTEYDYGKCAQTKREDRLPKWAVMFNRNFTVNRYKIYSDTYGIKIVHGNDGFVLKGLNQEGNVVFIDRGLGEILYNVYIVTTATATSPIEQVRIESTDTIRIYSFIPTALLLCELEVYGESICEKGWFGLDCEHKCNCVDVDEVCFVSTGGCISGCAPGYKGDGCLDTCQPGRFGQNCKSICSQLCLTNSSNDHLCDHTNGTCLLGCQIGFEGPWCNSTCTMGTYGQDCSYECSKFCVSDGNSNTSSCHHQHGVCLHGCHSGYKGLMCNEPCETDYFGQDCNFTCSQFCLGDNNNVSICDHVTGRCLSGCQPGYDGPWCNRTCPVGNYGRACKFSCSQFCQMDNTSRPVCDHVNGYCLQGCQDGYVGHFCEELCRSGSYGANCKTNCSESCAVDSCGVHVCHHGSGVCLRGCQKGFQGSFCNKPCTNGSHGEECSAPCPQFCETSDLEDPICHNVDGTCLQGCQIGYFGPTCNETCNPGYFGLDCQFMCPQFCQVVAANSSTCHHINGTCLEGCQPGFTGPMCKHNCPLGTFGPDCSLHCSNFCNHDNRSCDPVDGVCLHGCRSGFTGPLCKEIVLSSYYFRSCHHINGTCLKGCQPGFMGPMCKHTCPLGTFGPDCSLNCSEFCNHDNRSCDPVDGVCLHGCRSGFTGSLCKETCNRGYFGLDCQFMCSQFCQVVTANSSTCHHINGTCLEGCQPGFLGPMCENNLSACPLGTFGPDCGLNCSDFCNHDNRSCDPVDGVCLHGCRSGFTGPLCKEKCSPGKFGLACKFDCSRQCQGAVPSCSHMNGSCLFGCREGFEGQNCTSAIRTEDSSNDTSTLWVAIVICCVLLATAIAIVWRRRNEIKSCRMYRAMQVKMRKSSSTANMITTDVIEFGSQGISV